MNKLLKSHYQPDSDFSKILWLCSLCNNYQNHLHIFPCLAAHLLKVQKEKNRQCHYRTDNTAPAAWLIYNYYYLPCVDSEWIIWTFWAYLVFPWPVKCQMWLWDLHLIAFIDLGYSRMKTCFPLGLILIWLLHLWPPSCQLVSAPLWSWRCELVNDITTVWRLELNYLPVLRTWVLGQHINHISW